MENSELNKQLREAAIKNGLCEQWQGYWRRDWDFEKMVERFFTGIDFFLKNRFISNYMFKDGFSKDFLRKHAVLVDDEYSLLNPEKSILIGKSQSNMRFNGRTIATSYIVDQSVGNITAKGKAFVLIHLLDDAHVNVIQQDSAEVVVIIHSPTCKVTTSDTITIKYELDYLRF